MAHVTLSEHGKIIKLDWSLLTAYDHEPENAKFYQLTDRQCAALISICEYLYWKKRYLGMPVDYDLFAFASDTEYRLKIPIDPGECQTFPPFASFITYEPNDPYRTPDLVPDGYIFPPWYVANTAAEVTYDAQLGAAVTTFERLPALTPASGFPRFRVTVNGIGRVTLHLAAVNIGGMCQITVDDDLPSVELIDLIQDKIAIPPETANILEKEYTFAVAGEHRIDVIMLPALQDQIPPVMFGGGLNAVTLCGFGLKLPEEGLMLRQSTTDPCVLEQSADGETWSEAFNFAQCPSIASGGDVTQISNATYVNDYNRRRAESAARNAEYQAEYTGDPSSINPDAPDDNFDGDNSPSRNYALCGACTAFVRAYCAAKLQQIEIVYGLAYTVLAITALAIPGFGWALAAGIGIAIGASAALLGYTEFVVQAALKDTTALDAVACCMFQSLDGAAINTANFEASLTACGFSSGSNSAIARDFVAAGLADNYLNFCDFLGAADAAYLDGQPVECACDFDVTYFLVPLDAAITVDALDGVTTGDFRIINTPWTTTLTLPTSINIFNVEMLFSNELDGGVGPTVDVIINSTTYPFHDGTNLGGAQVTHDIDVNQTSDTIVVQANHRYHYIRSIRVRGIN